jgi:LPXTG-motif cell wall-anchored protein
MNKKIKFLIGSLLASLLKFHNAKAQGGQAIDVYGVSNYNPTTTARYQAGSITIFDKISNNAITLIVLGVIAFMIGIIYVIKRRRKKND